MKRWLLTFYAAFALRRADVAGARADQWIARAKWAQAKIRKMETSDDNHR